MDQSLHLVMHGTAIKKNGSAASIASLCGMDSDLVEAGLQRAVEGGRVIAVDGKYMLAPAGHMIVGAEYSRFFAELRNNVDFIAAYDRFEAINHDLKQLITRWQTMEIGGQRVANDHSDSAYDENVIGQLGDLHERFAAVIDAMIKAEPRYAIYKAKLTAALEKAEDGDIAWVSDARSESYHTVWFELHEDLLRVLGRTREE